MSSLQTQPRNETTAPAAVPPGSRRCLVSGEVKPKEKLVRFVLDPSGSLVPDLEGRLPGRGLWVSADRATIEDSCRKNPFSRAAKTRVQVPADLMDMLDRLFARRCLQLLGLARAARAVVTGQPQVEEALSNDTLSYILLAADAGRDVRKKLARATLAPSGFDREALGAALGRDHLVAVGLRRHPLADKLHTELLRWHGACARSDSDPFHEVTESTELT